MKRVLKDGNTHILSAKRGQDLMEQIKMFCAEHHIEAAYFHVMGAAGEVELAWYDLEAKQYGKEQLRENLEIVSLTGNVSKLGEDLVVHGHGVFSNAAMETKAGHVSKAVVSGACEVVLVQLEGKLEREYDEETGLNLLR
ncbi:MAG: DNA-binding protein [Candidatus Yanofskybacteria bacterium]|nr:DNA-binding protein [Candidatus Yanofskybacteria bacterium]